MSEQEYYYIREHITSLEERCQALDLQLAKLQAKRDTLHDERIQLGVALHNQIEADSKEP